MGKSERVEDLGKISVLTSQILLKDLWMHHSAHDISTWIQVYSDKQNLEELFYEINKMKKEIMNVFMISKGEEE